MSINIFTSSDINLRKAFDQMEGKGAYRTSSQSWEQPKGTLFGARQCHEQFRQKGEFDSVPGTWIVYEIIGRKTGKHYFLYPNGDVKLFLAAGEADLSLGQKAKEAGIDVVRKELPKLPQEDEEE